MKELFSIIFALIIMMFCAACGDTNSDIIGNSDSNAPYTDENRKAVDTLSGNENEAPVLYPVKYIRTDGYREGIKFPYTVKIGSVSELENYISENEDHYFLGHVEKVYSDTTIGFADAIAEYDEAFFETKMLVMAIFEEGSGSNRHELVGVTADDVIQAKRITPAEGTCDMAEWHIILEMPRERAERHIFTAEYYGEDNRELAVFGQNFILMSARVPKGWNYELKPYRENSDTMGMELYPKASPSSRVKIYFVDRDYLMDCGTGYDFVSVKAGKYNATRIRTASWVGENNNWEMYSYHDMPGIYTLEVSGFADNKEEYQGAINEIIESLELSNEDFIDRRKAMELAKAECTVEYDLISAKLDFISGLWRIHFYKYETAGGDQTVNLYLNGKYHSSEYGE